MEGGFLSDERGEECPGVEFRDIFVRDHCDVVVVKSVFLEK